jgi:hypothetical protein
MHPGAALGQNVFFQLILVIRAIAVAVIAPAAKIAQAANCIMRLTLRIARVYRGLEHQLSYFQSHSILVQVV